MKRLDPQDRNSRTWAVLKEQLEIRLATLRQQNDDASKDERETALLRGRIKEVKWLLSLGEEPKPEVTIEEEF